MIKRKQNISLNILLVAVMLLLVLILSIGAGNAWFVTEQNRGYYFSVRVNEFNVLVEQLTNNGGSETATEIYTYKKNNIEQTNKYIVLSQILAPEEEINLKLKLTNKDQGEGVYLRYCLNLYACGVDGDTIIPINITCGEDFNKNGNYYYYVDFNDTNKTITKDTATILCTGFSIPYSSFQTLNGGETVKIELVVECANSVAEF